VPDRPTKYRGIIKTDAFKKLPSALDERKKPRYAYWKKAKLDKDEVRFTHDASRETTDKTRDIDGEI